MDTEKNWVNWKYYNPNSNLSIISHTLTNSITYTFDKSGMYLFVFTGCQAQSTIQSTVSRTQILANYSVSNGDRYLTAAILNAEVGELFSVTRSNSNYQPTMQLYYICSEFGTGTIVNTTLNLSRVTLTNVSNRILVVSNNGTGGSPYITIDCSTDDKTTDGKYYGICSSVNQIGSMSIYGQAFSSGSTPVTLDIEITF